MGGEVPAFSAADLLSDFKKARGRKAEVVDKLLKVNYMNVGAIKRTHVPAI